MFTRSIQTRRDLGGKELGQAYDQLEQVMTRMNNYSTRPSALPFLAYIPSKTPRSVLRDSDTIYEVHPYAKLVPADQRIRSLGTSLETFKGEATIIKEYGGCQGKWCRRLVRFVGYMGDGSVSFGVTPDHTSFFAMVSVRAQRICQDPPEGNGDSAPAAPPPLNLTVV